LPYPSDPPHLPRDIRRDLGDAAAPQAPVSRSPACRRVGRPPAGRTCEPDEQLVGGEAEQDEVGPAANGDHVVHAADGESSSRRRPRHPLSAWPPEAPDQATEAEHENIVAQTFGCVGVPATSQGCSGGCGEDDSVCESRQMPRRRAAGVLAHTSGARATPKAQYADDYGAGLTRGPQNSLGVRRARTSELRAAPTEAAAPPHDVERESQAGDAEGDQSREIHARIVG
jgi:hypothetical protein